MVDDPSRDQPLRGPDPRVVGIWREVTSAGHCRHPIHLIGERVDRETGEILPASVLLACKDRRAVLCPSCAAVYKADAWFLVTAGLTGGKGMTQNIKEHPRLFLTLTAPSFGLVHTIRDDGTCHPRRKQRCAHGRPRSCSIRHEPHHDDLGGPLCEDCFDFDGAVLWNAAASKLWNRTIDRARKVLAGSRGLTLVELRREAQLQYLRVAETQRRGLVHLHVVIRADGPLAASPPPPWLTPEVLERAVRQAVVATAVPTGLGGWARWGRQLDLVDIGSSEGDAARVAGYVAKYATKTTDGDFGLARRFRDAEDLALARTARHLQLLAESAWELGDLDELKELRLKDHAHTLGFTGQLVTKSRGFSTTFGALRAARADFAAVEYEPPLLEGGYLFAGRGYSDPRAETLSEWLTEVDVEMRKERRLRRIDDANLPASRRE